MVGLVFWTFSVVSIFFGIMFGLLLRRLNKAEQLVAVLCASVAAAEAQADTKINRAIRQREAEFAAREKAIEQKFRDAERMAADVTLVSMRVTGELWDFANSLKEPVTANTSPYHYTSEWGSDPNEVNALTYPHTVKYCEDHPNECGSNAR